VPLRGRVLNYLRVNTGKYSAKGLLIQEFN